MSQCPGLRGGGARELSQDGRRRRSRNAAGGCRARQCRLGADRQARAFAADLEAGDVRVSLLRTILTTAAILAAMSALARPRKPPARRQRRRIRPAASPNGARSMRSFRIRAAPTAMSPTIARAGPAPTTASPACMASMSGAATTAAASAIPACAARAVISPAIPACCMDRPGAGNWRLAPAEMVWWQKSSAADLRADQGSRRATAAARSKRSPRMCATTGWSAGDGIPARAANPLPARPKQTCRGDREMGRGRGALSGRLIQR